VRRSCRSILSIPSCPYLRMKVCMVLSATDWPQGRGEWNLKTGDQFFETRLSWGGCFPGERQGKRNWISQAPAVYGCYAGSCQVGGFQYHQEIRIFLSV
jgi:hypothetical protein